MFMENICSAKLGDRQKGKWWNYGRDWIEKMLEKEGSQEQTAIGRTYAENEQRD